MANKYVIKKRHKDSKGNIIGYTADNISTGEKDIKFKAEFLELHANEVVNAHVVNNHGFVADKGSHIDTVVDYSDLGVHKVKPKLLSGNGSSTVIDYYGRDYTNICRKIRSAAISGRIKIDKNPHTSNGGNNLHLFKLIEACGISVDAFVISYLSVIQPYSLDKFLKAKQPDGQTWIADIGYNVKLVIKAQNLFGQAYEDVFLISFHESNIHGISQYKHGSLFNEKEYCAVLCDSIGDKECNKYPYKATVQRGFIRHQISGFADYVNKDVALVKYKDIKSKFSDSMEVILNRLNEMYYSNELKSSITYMDNLHRLSFLSFGYADINNVIFLIESFRITTNPSEKRVIAEVSKSLLEEISDSRRKEIVNGLKEKYNLSDKQTIADNPLLETLVDIT